MSHLGIHFKKKRETMHLKVSQLAQLAGYRNLNKGSRRIHALEKHGIVRPDLLCKLAVVLGISETEYTPLLRADEQDRLNAWAEWVNQPIKPYVVVRLMAAIYSPLELPEWIVTQPQAEQFVSEKAKELRLRCCLVWSRRLSIYFAADGTVDAVLEATPAEDVAPHPLMRWSDWP